MGASGAAPRGRAGDPRGSWSGVANGGAAIAFRGRTTSGARSSPGAGIRRCGGLGSGGSRRCCGGGGKGSRPAPGPSGAGSGSEPMRARVATGRGPSGSAGSTSVTPAPAIANSTSGTAVPAARRPVNKAGANGYGGYGGSGGRGGTSAAITGRWSGPIRAMRNGGRASGSGPITSNAGTRWTKDPSHL